MDISVCEEYDNFVFCYALAAALHVLAPVADAAV